jgi:hypothetical protein
MTERDRDLQALSETVDFYVYWAGVGLVILWVMWPLLLATLFYFLFVFPQPCQWIFLLIGFVGTAGMMTRDPTKVIAWISRNVWHR